MNFVSWMKNTEGFNNSIFEVRLSRFPESPLQFIPIIIRPLSFVLFTVLRVLLEFNNFFTFLEAWFPLKKETFQEYYAKICSLVYYSSFHNDMLQFQCGDFCKAQNCHNVLYSNQYRCHLTVFVHGSIRQPQYAKCPWGCT